VVGPDTEKHAWAEGMAGQHMANIVLRLTTHGGLEGIAGAAMIWLAAVRRRSATADSRATPPP